MIIHTRLYVSSSFCFLLVPSFSWLQSFSFGKRGHGGSWSSSACEVRMPATMNIFLVFFHNILPWAEIVFVHG